MISYNIPIFDALLELLCYRAVKRPRENLAGRLAQALEQAKATNGRCTQGFLGVISHVHAMYMSV